MTRKEARQRAKELVSRMTLEEMASQLRFDAPAIKRLQVPEYNWWNEALHGVARAGTATVFPQAIGMAAMFDAERLEKIAAVIATEARAKYNESARQGDRDIYKGLSFWSPNVNIFRDPRWGRGHETYGEDPYLTARLGVAFVKGLQGSGKYLKSAACAKHYAVHSGPEAIRHAFDARPTKKDMEETYLYAFEKLVKEANVEAVMGAYNRVNGEPACGSKTLLKDILRDRWGFEGHVVSDCWAISDFHLHHRVTDTAPQSAAMAIDAGCDVNCGNTYLHLLQAVAEGLVTKEQIELAATRLFTTRFMLGLFDEDCEYNKIGYMENDTDANACLAREAAADSMVLLQNDGILPLDRAKLGTIGVIGPNANSIACLEGNYQGTSSRYVTFLEGIRREAGEGIRVLYAQGSALKDEKVEGLARNGDRILEAVSVAQHADVSIVCLGLDATIEGEEDKNFTGDKDDLELPRCQRDLLDAVLAAGKPVVIVVAAGSNLRVEGGNALLWAWYPGQAGGDALCDILFGRKSPSGKLPLTFYKSLEDLPEFTDYSMENRTYRYFAGEPLYPFGYGLGYTQFAYGDASFDAQSNTLSVCIENIGKMNGDEIAQVYIKPLDSEFAPRNHSLCGFKRVSLFAEEKKRVEIQLSQEAFTVVNEEGQRVSGGRRYILYVGGSQPDERSAALMKKRPLEIEVQIG